MPPPTHTPPDNSLNSTLIQSIQYKEYLILLCLETSHEVVMKNNNQRTVLIFISLSHIIHLIFLKSGEQENELKSRISLQNQETWQVCHYLINILVISKALK